MKLLLTCTCVLCFLSIYGQTASVKINPDAYYYLDDKAITKEKPKTIDDQFEITTTLNDKGYFFAYYHKSPVFIKANDIMPNKEYNNFIDNYFVKPSEKASRNEFNERNKELFSKFGKRFGFFILNHELTTGMTPEMVTASWGKPFDTVRTETEYDVAYMWVYNTDTYKKKYVFFNHGIVTQIDQ